MLFPSKHDHPDQTVLAAGCIMFVYLAERQVASYDDLLAHCRTHKRFSEYLFSPALSLLYLLGLVQYLPKADSFEWIGKRAS